MNSPTRQAWTLAVVIFACLLLLILGPAASAIAQPASSVSLPCHPIGPNADEEFGYGASDPFQRELIRQAILLAAREELGLTTRDAILGEPLADSAQGGLIDYGLALEHANPIGVTLIVGGEERASHEVPAAMGRLDGYPLLMASAEAYSRTDGVEALRACGFEAEPVPQAPPEPLPASLAQRVFDLDLVTQYDLVRALHALIHDDGYNLERLTALSIAYANLAQLTRYRLDFTQRAMIARAMLYARRATALYPDHPEGHWAQAYAWVMFDLPGFGMDEITRGKEVCENLATPADEPAWLPLLEMYDRYDTFELMDAARAGGPHRELAALLAVVSTESSDTAGLMHLAMDLCMEINPDGVRAYFCDTSGRQIVTRSWYYPYAHIARLVEAVPQNLLGLGRGRLPDEAERALTHIDIDEPWDALYALSQAAWALEDSAADEPGREFGNAVLGHFIEGAVASNLVVVCSITAVSSNPRRIPWDTVGLALDRHPYRDYILICQYHINLAHNAKRELIRGVTLGDYNMVLGLGLTQIDPANITFANVDEDTAWSWMLDQKTQTIPDMWWYSILYDNGDGFNMYSSWITEAAPHAPLRAISRIDWRDFNEQQIDDHVADYAYMPGVLVAAANWYQRNDDPGQAFGLLWEAIEMIPDKELEYRAAELGLKIGEEHIWLELMERVRAGDRSSPPFVDADLVIAQSYMQAQEWEKALPYAEENLAHHRFNLAAVYTMAWCLHELDRTDEAIDLFMAFDQRFTDDHTYCVLQVWGLEDEAVQAAQWYEETILPRHTRQDPRRTSAFHTFQQLNHGQEEEALDGMIESWEEFNNVNDAIRIAILAQKLDRPELRDEMLEALIDEAQSDPGDDRVAIMSRIAQLIFACDGGPPSDEQIRAFLGEHGRPEQDANALLNLGWYLMVSGEQERATAWLLELLALKHYKMANYEKVQAALLLRQSGYDFETHVWRFPEAHDWPED